MEAFFADIKEAANGRREAGMPILSEQQTAQLKTLDERLAAAKAALETDTPELAAAQLKWEQSAAGQRSVHWTTLTPTAATSENKTVLKIQPDGVILATGAAPNTDVFTITASTDLKSILRIPSRSAYRRFSSPQRPRPGRQRQLCTDAL